MGNKLCPKTIFEGTRLTLKTEIAFALNEHPRIVGPRKYRYHSPLVSGEWCAFTNYPWGRGLINFEPHEEALAMETYRTILPTFELDISDNDIGRSVNRIADWLTDTGGLWANY